MNGRRLCSCWWMEMEDNVRLPASRGFEINFAWRDMIFDIVIQKAQKEYEAKPKSQAVRFVPRCRDAVRSGKTGSYVAKQSNM
jgi:hypothetical protein